MVDDIDSPYSIDRDATLYYFFQGNQNGTARAKRELRYGRGMWKSGSSVRIRIPFLTQYPLSGNPYSGLGDVEVGYSNNVASPPFDHSTELRIVLPTATNGVQSLDTQFKGFYTTKWKWPHTSIVYVNEFDQSVIVPPGSLWTSYYEGKLTLPNSAFVRTIRGLHLAAFYDYRVLFDSGGVYKDALGGMLFGNINDVALSVTDSWGIGTNALWKYKFEINMTARL